MEETAETETELIFEGDLGNVFTTDGDGTQVNEVDAVTESAVSGIQMSAEDQEAAMLIGQLETAGNEAAQLHQQMMMENQQEEHVVQEQQEMQEEDSAHHHVVAAEEEITLEDQLRSTEKLDRSSPDLWPKNLSSAAQYIMAKYLQKTGESEPNSGIWAQGLDPEDINLLHQFGSLTSASLVEEVKKLQNIAYQLGLEETKEMTRGKLLHILDDDQ